MTGRTVLYRDQRCLWHHGGGYALTAPVGGFVQPLAAGGIPEDPETKRRLLNLLDVTGLGADLEQRSAKPATREDLERVHTRAYLDDFKALSDTGGGEMEPGARAPFGPGGYEMAALSAGLAKAALFDVLEGKCRNAYSLSRPPGHHCLPDRANGFCLLANIAIAIEAAIAAGHRLRFAVVDWDVHHGNGTEAIFYDRADVLAISIHQDRNYPWDTGGVADQGRGAGDGTNMNIPLPPGAGEVTYLEAMDRLVLPKLRAYAPDFVIVACGFDASVVDPLSRMLLGARAFKEMTARLMDLTGGRMLMVHEGGYSELHVPFCGHAVLAAMAGSGIDAGDPVGPRADAQQPDEGMARVFSDRISGMVDAFGLAS